MTAIQTYKKEMRAIMRAQDALRRRAIRASVRLIKVEGAE